MIGKRIAALSGTVICLAGANAAEATDPGGGVSAQDAKAQFNARNLTSEVEACWTDTMDYRACRTAAVLNAGMGRFAVPIGSHPGQARVARATATTYVIDAYSRSGNHFFVTKQSSGSLRRSCTRHGRGRCPRGGRW